MNFETEIGTRTQTGFKRFQSVGRFQYGFQQESQSTVRENSQVFPKLQQKRELLWKNTQTNWVMSPTGNIPQKAHIKIVDYKPRADCERLPQRHHIKAAQSSHFEDIIQGKRTFERANRDSLNMGSIEDMLGCKIKIQTKAEQRNHIPERSPADKNYKAVEYQEKFFLMDDGLIPGSNVRKRTRVPFKISKKFH